MPNFFEPGFVQANQKLAEDKFTPEQLRAENEAVLQQVGKNLTPTEFEKLKQYLNAKIEEIIMLQEYRDRLRESTLSHTEQNSAEKSNTPG